MCIRVVYGHASHREVQYGHIFIRVVWPYIYVVRPRYMVPRCQHELELDSSFVTTEQIIVPDYRLVRGCIVATAMQSRGTPACSTDIPVIYIRHYRVTIYRNLYGTLFAYISIGCPHFEPSQHRTSTPRPCPSLLRFVDLKKRYISTNRSSSPVSDANLIPTRWQIYIR